MYYTQKITSAIIVALFLFAVTISTKQAACRPLTPSMYTVDEGSIEGYCGIDVIQTRSVYIKENVQIDTGILQGTDLKFSASLLQGSVKELSNNTVGDCTIGIWHSFGLLFNTFSSGFLMELGLPTAPDAFYNETTFPTESGFTTFSLTLVTAYNKNEITIVVSGCYTLIPKTGESVFDGLSFNVSRSSTWGSAFGLNPFKKDSMLYYKKLSDDVVYFSMSAVYDIYPVLPYISFCVGDRVNNSTVYGEHNLPVLYRGYNDTVFLVASSGIRYFFSEKTYIGTGVIYNCIRDYAYSLHYAIGIEASSVW